jgi:hypothetical protein
LLDFYDRRVVSAESRVVEESLLSNPALEFWRQLRHIASRQDIQRLDEGVSILAQFSDVVRSRLNQRLVIREVPLPSIIR